MAKKDKGMIFAVSFSSAAISASLVFFGMQMGGSGATGLSDSDLQAAIFKGIETYIEQKEQEYVDQEEEVNSIPEFPDLGQDFWDDDAIIGDPNAPVKIVEFSDYECPFCKRFYTDTLSQIKENYIDSGKVVFMYRDYPIPSHAGAFPAALAAECARDQGGDSTYFKMHDYIFDNGSNLDALLAYGGSLDGVDSDELNDCVDKEKFADEIYDDVDDASGLLLPAEIAAGGGIGTPTAVINGVRVRGAQPYSVFEKIIEEALEEA